MRATVRRRGARQLVATFAAASMVLVTAGVATADTIIAGDLIEGNVVAGSSVTAVRGETVNKQIAFEVICDSGNHLARNTVHQLGSNQAWLNDDATSIVTVPTAGTVSVPNTWPTSGPCPADPGTATTTPATVAIAVPETIALGDHLVRVRFTNLSGVGGQTEVDIDLTVVPRAPTSLGATADGPDTIDLSWGHSPDHADIDGYRVYRRVGTSADYSLVHTETKSGTSPQTKADTGLDAGTEYCYQVTAYAGLLESAPVSACATTEEASSLTLTGFHRPVDEGWNTMKGGRAVPLKFNVFDGDTEITDTSIVDSFRAIRISCLTAEGTEGGDLDLEAATSTSGKTELRYGDDSFIQNWKTNKVSEDTCFRVELTAGGERITAKFMLTR